MAQSIDSTTVQKYTFFKRLEYCSSHIYSQLNSQPRTTCMPCKPIRRKYSSKNEVILPSDRRGSMAYHAVPRVMMYQGDACVPLEAEAILRGLRWWRTKVWNNGCFVHLGRCGIVIWRLIAHYYYWAGTSGVRPPLLFCTVIWCLICRPGCYMSHMSATGSTEFMEGSVDGGVYYKIHERGRLSFGKIYFYRVRTH